MMSLSVYVMTSQVQLAVCLVCLIYIHSSVLLLHFYKCFMCDEALCLWIKDECKVRDIYVYYP